MPYSVTIVDVNLANKDICRGYVRVAGNGKRQLEQGLRDRDQKVW